MREIKVNRPTLGPFMHVVCFRYLVEDADDLAGRALIVDAGRQRGQDLIEQLGKKGTHQKAQDIQRELDDALGLNGTRLCIIQSVTEKDNGGFQIHAMECASPAYTMGVLVGAISAITGVSMLGKETDVGAEGPEARIYDIDPLG